MPAMFRQSLHALALLLLSTTLVSCESADRVLKATEQAVAGRTGRDVLAVVGGKDPSKIAKERLDSYAQDPERLLRDLRTAQQEFQTLYDALTGNVKDKWGPKEVKLPEKKKYVKYTQNYRSRAIVDFDRGQITVETVDETNPRASLTRAVVVTLLTPQDPRLVDVFSDKEVPVNNNEEPYLLGLVLDQHGKPIRTQAEAEAFANHLLDKKTGTRVIEQGEARKLATFVTMNMVVNLPQK